MRPLDSNSPSDKKRQEIYAVVAFNLLPVFLHILHCEKLSIDEMNYALKLSCYYARSTWVRTLIDSGASPLPESYMRGYSPLVLSCRKVHSISTTFTESASIFDILLKSGVSLDWRNSDGDTELHMAAFAGDLSVVECLIYFGSSVELTNNEGDTPLHVTTKCDDWRSVPYIICELCSKGERV